MIPSRISRRSFLTQVSLAALAFRRTSNSWAFAPDEQPIVSTRNGKLRGERSNGVQVFRGVPFAEPPVGDLRFRPAVSIKPWQGERDATRFGPAPLQTGQANVPHSEDCLQLNIWAPNQKGSHPVFVWIHGGGFVGGHAFEEMYDGSEFAREGIVCVTIAYRLGVFGFLDFEPLLGKDYAGTANNALHDLITGLRWIQENIAEFGGDPARVTIGGESAGAKLADILMGVPEAQPLFHQVISESGGAERVNPHPVSLQVAQGFGEVWRKQSGKENRQLLTEDGSALIEAQQQFIADWPQHFPLRPEVDGMLLPRLPVETIAGGSTRGKRLLIGTNRDESSFFVGPHPSKDATAADIGNLSLEKFLGVYQNYKALYPDLSPEQRRIRALSAEEYWVPSMRVADAHLKGGGTAFVYRLDFTETSGKFQNYAYHSLDVGLVWDHPHASVANATAEAAIASQIHQAWASFIRGDIPAASGLPNWPVFDEQTRSTMILNTESHVEQSPQKTDLKLWDGVL